jgi:hypothetical protein
MVRLTFPLVSRLPFPNSPPLIGAAGVSGKHGFPNVPVSGVSGTDSAEPEQQARRCGLGDRMRTER